MKTLFIVLGTVLVLCICCEDGDDEKDTSGTGLDVREKTDITAPEDVGDATHSDGTGETAGDISTDLPDSAGPGLPYEMTRPDVGEPLTDAEITAFTKAITGFYKNAGFFGWLWWTGHGMHSSHDPDMPDYRLYWQDTQSFKEGDTLRFAHTGGADNLALRTAKLTNAVAAAYLKTDHPMFGRLVEQYCKGFVALSQGLEWSSEEPVVKYLQARAIFTVDHEYEMEGGRKVKVEYGPVKNEKYDWNAHTIPNDENPYWGPIWVRTMRSKDDVPHMYRTMPLLKRVAANGQDPEVRKAAELAVEYLSGFAKDIVDSGYYIRTKDTDGNTYIPKQENGTDNDLASFVTYESVIPNAECSGKIASAYLGYGEALDNDCGFNDTNLYEDMAIEGHYFNAAIIRYMHLAAITTGFDSGDMVKTQTMLEGAIKRADRLTADEKMPLAHKEWYPDLAGWLLAAASSGLPLTSAEARLIAQEYSASAAHYEKFPYWDPWADGVEDGQFNYKPDRDGPSIPDDPDSPTRKHVRLPEIGFVLEYCFSPYLNPNGAKLLDCDVVANPDLWGE